MTIDDLMEIHAEAVYQEKEQKKRKYEYQKYLRSKSYQKKRVDIIKSRGGKCEICKRTENLVLHHKTYSSRRGHEKSKELQVLCRSCHYKEHFTKDGKLKDMQQ